MPTLYRFSTEKTDCTKSEYIFTRKLPSCSTRVVGFVANYCKIEQAKQWIVEWGLSLVMGAFHVSGWIKRHEIVSARHCQRWHSTCSQNDRKQCPYSQINVSSQMLVPNESIVMHLKSVSNFINVSSNLVWVTACFINCSLTG